MPVEPVTHWTADPTQLWAYALRLDTEHAPRLALDRACLRLSYERPQLNGYDFDASTGNFYRRSGQQAFYEMGPSLTREVTGAAAANLCRQLMIKVVPSGADPDLYAKCEAASNAGNGVLEGSRYLVTTKQRVVMDSLHCCVGAVKVFVDRGTKELCVERADPLALRWPRGQDRPYDILENHAIPRRKLLIDYADDAKAVELIRSAPRWNQPPIPGVEVFQQNSPESDCIRLVEAYSVSLGGQPGMHAFAVQGGLLEEPEEYDHEVLPYAFTRYEWDYRGIEGVSLARIIAPYDIRNRRLSRMIDESIKGCIPVIWEHVSEEAFEGLDDVAYQRGRYSGARPPEITVAGKVSQDVASEREANRQHAYAEGGISYEMGRGQLPAGLKSAPSINAYSETVSLRQLLQQQRTEQLDADVGDLICRFGPGSKMVRVSKGRDYLSEVKFPDLKKNKFRVVVLAASGLPRTLSGRIAAVEALAAVKKDLTPEQIGQMIDLPDIQAMGAESLSHRRLAETIAGDALADAVWPKWGIPNDPKLLAELVVLSRSLLMQALDKGTFPEENMATLYRVIRVTESMIDTPPAAPPIPTPPAALPALPAAPLDAPLVAEGEAPPPLAAPAPIPPIA